LFARAEDFQRLNARYFPNHPISVLRLGNGRFAVIDGHHRLWQAGVLFGRDAQVPVRIVSSRNEDLLRAFRDQVRRVAELNGSAALRSLPIRDKPRLPPSETGNENETEIVPPWLDEMPWIWYEPDSSPNVGER